MTVWYSGLIDATTEEVFYTKTACCLRPKFHIVIMRVGEKTEGQP